MSVVKSSKSKPVKSSIEDMVFTGVGTVKWFNKKNNYGFISMKAENGTEFDVFFHGTNVANIMAEPEQGATVEISYRPSRSKGPDTFETVALLAYHYNDFVVRDGYYEGVVKWWAKKEDKRFGYVVIPGFRKDVFVGNKTLEDAAATNIPVDSLETDDLIRVRPRISTRGIEAQQIWRPVQREADGTVVWGEPVAGTSVVLTAETKDAVDA